ncbi:MAG: YwbE family protein [Candidatus Staskawiczbacteria bacterium]|nr:YwbE family protein [Candidatus Staskawiczbacteria bacterium]
MDGTVRANIRIGGEVDIVLKKDQPTGKLTHGKVARILTSDSQHHRGVKVMLEDGQVGRVQKVYPKLPTINGQEYQEGLI